MSEDYAWSGLPPCEHGYQFNCNLCAGDQEHHDTWLIERVLDAAGEVHKELGSGHTETVYEAALEVELGLKDIGPIRRQVPCPITYKGSVIGTGFIDILIGDILIVELKTIIKLTSKERAQVRKYLQGTGAQVGLLLNFGQTPEWTLVKHTKEPDHEQTSRQTD